MDNWDKTKIDLIKKLAADDMPIDNLLDNLSVFAGMFSSEQAEYGLPTDDDNGRDMMRMVVLSWLAKL